MTFYEWYISTQRIDGIDFHLRETAANFRSAEGRRQAGQRYEVEHEVLAPKVQLYGEIAILSYTLLMRYTSDAGVRHTEHNETRVPPAAGWLAARALPQIAHVACPARAGMNRRAAPLEEFG